MTEPSEVLSFWFGALDAAGRSDAMHAARWWKKDPAFDQEIRDRFGALHAALVGGAGRDWLSAPRGRLAYVVVLDQFSRNMFRDSARMYEGDALAFAAADEGIASGADAALGLDERSFLYLPLVHSEHRGAQARVLALFTAWRDRSEGDDRAAVERLLGFVRQHHDIVARFGRFPHRNALLGRPSTPEEVAFLAQPGSSF